MVILTILGMALGYIVFNRMFRGRSFPYFYHVVFGALFIAGVVLSLVTFSYLLAVGVLSLVFLTIGFLINELFRANKNENK